MKDIDITIFGATGFTGKHVVQELYSQKSKLKIAIAGRSAKKLEEISKRGLEIIEADVNDQESLNAMCKRSKVVINCVGPFRFFGKQVVRACVENGTSYCDISGEPEFIEKCFVEFEEKAKETGCVVVSACGFDSVPADIGLAWTCSLFPTGSEIVSGESFLELKTSKSARINYGTFETAVESIAHERDLRRFRKEHPRKLNYLKPRLTKKLLPFWNEKLGKYCVVFPGSDAAIVRMTQVCETNRSPVQYMAYLAVDGLLQLIGLFIFGLVMILFTRFSAGISLLKNYPEFFSFGLFGKEGPTDEQIASTSFSTQFSVSGRIDGEEIQINSKVSGPEPGYVTTPICVVAAALMLLQKDDLKVKSGVYTPASAFNIPKMVSRLTQRGISFEQLK